MKRGVVGNQYKPQNHRLLRFLRMVAAEVPCLKQMLLIETCSKVGLLNPNMPLHQTKRISLDRQYSENSPPLLHVLRYPAICLQDPIAVQKDTQLNVRDILC